MLGLALTPTDRAAGRTGATALQNQVIAVALAAGGAYYDPSVMSSLFQDAAGATPVTASGQSVRLMRDLSGNGKHMVAPSDAARPVLTSEVIDGVTYWYLATDGVDDVMVATPALDLTTTWWGVGAWRIDAVGNRYLFGVAANTAKGAAKASTNTVQWRNTADSGFTTLISTVTLSVPAVLSFQQTAPTVLSGRKNRVDGSTIGCLDTTALSRGLALFADRGVGAFGQFFTGRFYGGVWGPSTISTTNRDLVERLIAQRAGVAL